MGEMLGNLYLLLSCAFKNLAQDREVTINKVNKNMYTSIKKKHTCIEGYCKWNSNYTPR
jgi:hypothetical protein